jgi:phosphoribosylanthranilate isomerase
MLETAAKVNRNLMIPITSANKSKDMHRVHAKEGGKPNGPTPIIQIYEIQSPVEAEAIIEDGVDHVGSVILSSEHAKDAELAETIRLVQAAGKISSLIPLFSKLDDIRRVLDTYRPDIIHFCETLPLDSTDTGAADHLQATQQTVRQEFPQVKIMRSIPIGRPGLAEGVPTLVWAARFEALSDYFLTDTLLPTTTNVSGAQPVNGFVGITGQTCDWQIARELVRQARIPVILAGGLSPENVKDGICMVAPAGVDSCTATNQVDTQGKPIRFRKDRERVRQFIREARRAAGENRTGRVNPRSAMHDRAGS